MSKLQVARADVPKSQTWNAESVFADHDAWKAEYAQLTQDIQQLSSYPNTLTSSARLVEYLNLSDSLVRRASKLYFYATMSVAVNTGDTPSKALTGQAGALIGQLMAGLAFAEPEILALGESTVMQWVAQETKLSIYKHDFSDLFRKQKHVLSKEVEEILGMLSEPFNSVEEIFSELSNSDMKFETAKTASGSDFVVSQSTIQTALDSPDRSVRKTAWNNYADSYLAYKNTYAQTYLTAVKQQVMLTRVRKYDSVLHSVLEPNNISVDVFHNLISTFKANIKTWHRFWDVKRRILKVDQLHPYDIWAPMTQNPPVVNYEQSVEWIG
jgi:oligoendopeptidase F